ncbi:hypothetical protein [Nocardia sp. NPDC056000]|uniref:hypothetical protein n=1 Tax=Nocardia sp. NPDC056000 TaxID=3345674 RepID=UPI0035E062AE
MLRKKFGGFIIAAAVLGTGGIDIGAAGPAVAEALRCDNSHPEVCVHIRGDSIFVDKFAAYYYSPPVGCLQAHFFYTLAGMSTATGVYHDVCPTPDKYSSHDGYYYDTTGTTGVFQAGTLACAEWIGKPGVACADIKR